MADDVDTRLVRAFLAVAQEGSFTRAARTLGISQQAVSNQVARLEERLGETLFVRHGSGVALSAKGYDLRPQARELVGMTEALFRRARATEGTIRVGEIRGRRMMQEVWTRHRARRPQDVVSLQDLTGDEQVRAMLGGYLDIAMDRVTWPLPGIASVPLRYDPLMVLTVREIEAPTLHGTRLGYPHTSQDRFRGWQDFCEVVQRELDVTFERVPHDITMLEPIGQGQIRGDYPPVIALNGLRDYPGAEGFTFQRFEDVQPYFPWSLLWRADETRPQVLAFIETAREVAEEKGWLSLLPGGPPPWFPSDGIRPEDLPGQGLQDLPGQGLQDLPGQERHDG
ncbi:LysR family transcriptional regulator [Raineyella antarctica]|nr:LysR family transcriptional regulator [Raineyella antarctica]